MNEKKRTQKDTLLKVWGYIKKYRILVLLSVIFGALRQSVVPRLL